MLKDLQLAMHTCAESATVTADGVLAKDQAGATPITGAP
jgi:hypothetical protein